MTIGEILTGVSDRRPGEFEQAVLLGWLNQLEARIRAEIVDRAQDGPEDPFVPYTQADLDREPLGSGPYQDVYKFWLYAMMDYELAEFDRYNNHMAVFNAAYESLGKYWRRQHMPKQPAALNVGGVIR